MNTLISTARRRALSMGLGALALAAAPAFAAWPEKPIELVVGFAAGGGMTSRRAHSPCIWASNWVPRSWCPTSWAPRASWAWPMWPRLRQTVM